VRGSVMKRCTCPPAHDSAGRRKACARRHGSWSYVADVGEDPATGKRKQLKRSGFRTKDEAESALSALLRQLDDHGWTDDKGRTVTDWMLSWLANQESTGALRPSTLTMYRFYAEGRIRAHLGPVKLRDLKRPAVAAMIRSMVAAGDGPTTIHRCVAALRSALTAAVRASLIPINPARDVELPRRTTARANPWQPAELAAFLTEAETDRLGVLFELLAFTGMRRGEALALRWEEVDFVTRRLLVQRQLVQGQTPKCQWCGGGHKVAWREPKTAAGVRVVEMDKQTAGMLRGHRAAQQSERDEWAGAYTDHGLVFAREDGLPLYPTVVTHRFSQIVARTSTTGTDGPLPLRMIKLHDLRHGAASLGIAAGVPIEVVSKRLGHSSISVTADIYGHLLEGVGHQAAEAAAALVPRTRTFTL
jgi:integrase